MKLKERIYVIVGMVMGMILSATISYTVASTLINSKDVVYQDNSGLGATNVQAAIDGTCTKFNTQLTTLQTTIENNVDTKITTAKNDTLLKVYPVGSIYTSVNTTNPGTLFGGTWERIKGRFLLSADDTTYKINATGGEATHVLTVNEMPSHNHGITINIQHNADGEYVNSESLLSDIQVGGKRRYYDVTDLAGGDQAHNNMPPYLVVYMWKRTK